MWAIDVFKKQGGGKTKDISNHTQLVSEICVLITAKQHSLHFQDEDTEAYRREIIGTDCIQVHLETQQQNSDLLTPGSIIKCE